MNNYILGKGKREKKSKLSSIKEVVIYIKNDWIKIVLALIFVIISSGITVVGPYFIGDATNQFIQTGDKNGLLDSVIILFALYFVSFIANYLQIILMGTVGQSILFKLRNAIFSKLQELPLEFFNVNKSGDLISRINSDTEKLNQAFSETLLRFIGQIFIIIGVVVIMLWQDLTFGMYIISIAIILLIFTYLVTPWVRKKNDESLNSLGNLSAQVQESLSNFKVIVAFGRRDYLRKEFSEVNEINRIAATKSGIANGILSPIYDYGANIANLLVIFLGIVFLLNGRIEFGVLLSYILYTDRFFQPLRVMAQLFTSIQTALAAWNRISNVLDLKTNLRVLQSTGKIDSNNNEIIKFENVSFQYNEDAKVLHNINLSMEKGKTYAFVGPTGGGKSTAASLISRLFDATEGTIYLDGADIRTFDPEERSDKIGFILQEPFLFTGTIAENIKYGNPGIQDLSEEKLTELIKRKGLIQVLHRFEKGLSTKITNSANNISLGQKQLIAFIRALLRNPEILILDEATANIDTVTEDLLEKIVDALPENTTKVIIAHRLNTIEKADKIYFVAGGNISEAGSMKDALDLINNNKKAS